MHGYSSLGQIPPTVPGMVPLNAESAARAGLLPNSEDRRFWYTYQTPNIASIAAAASAVNSILFDADSVFVWLRTTFFADIAGAVQTDDSRVLPLVTVRIQDTGSGAYFQNAAVPLADIAGWGPLPYILPAPQIIQPVASIFFEWNNFSAATTYANLRLQMQGFKIKT